MNICFTSWAGLIHSNSNSHNKQKRKKRKKRKHTLHSAGYHISEQTEPQGLETSNLLCRDVMLHNANTTAATAQPVSHHATLKRALTLITSLPLQASKALWNSQGQRCCKSLCDSQPAPAELHGSQHPSRLWRRRRGEGRKLQLSSLNFASSEEVPWGWHRIRNLAEGLRLKCPLPCRCLPLLCTLWAVTLYLIDDTLHHQHYTDRGSHL